jgi:L-methionine (R)-S-oxide reductase
MRAMGNQQELSRALDDTLGEFDCVAGTIHVLDELTAVMKLRAHRGIPDAVLDKVRDVPIGKGMAGLAAARREPIQVCNLQTDQSGVAKPTARETKMAGSIAVPMLTRDGALKGTIGIAKPVAYDFTPDECERLMRIAAGIGEQLVSLAKT